MTPSDEVYYKPRTVEGWVEASVGGKVALADFQRSYVWGSGRSTKYIEAILKGKPVGLYLILAASEEPQFEARSFRQYDINLDNVQELVLDGQQRLTSLLHALYGDRDEFQHRFFIQIQDFSANLLEFVDIVCESKNTRRGRQLDDPVFAYHENLFPIDITRKEPQEDGLLPISVWCGRLADSMEEMDATDARRLENRISTYMDKCFFQRNLWYYLLPETTDAIEAAEIFMETNTSSVPITWFDISVALARGKHDENLRNATQEAYGRSDILRHYFSDNPEVYIPKIGEWLLKVACLHASELPKESNYKQAVSYLFRNNRELKKAFYDLDWALKRVEEYGAATQKMLPSWPPLHVLSALRRTVEQIRRPAKAGSARRLLDAYYWRSLFSSRYDARANDRLYQDYKELSEVLEHIEDEWSELAIFNEQDYPLYDADHLLRHATWIGSAGRLGKGLISAVMAQDRTPRDWFTGHLLTATKIRQFEGTRTLDRHHIFPQSVLKSSGIESVRINNGLNGVLLEKMTNQSLWKMPPNEYLEKMLDEGISETKLRQRIEGHKISYEELKSGKGTLGKRYDRFLRERAERLATLIEEIAEFPYKS